jgi:hypothetical protein
MKHLTTYLHLSPIALRPSPHSILLLLLLLCPFCVCVCARELDTILKIKPAHSANVRDQYSKASNDIAHINSDSRGQCIIIIIT